MNSLKLFKRLSLTFAIGLAAVTSSACTSAAVPETDPKAIKTAMQRADSLNPGISIWRWFRRPVRTSNSHYAGYISDAELRMIREWGFRSIRLPIGEPFLFEDGKLAAEPSLTSLEHLRTAIERMNRAGFIVVVDYHPGYSEKPKLERDSAQQAILVEMWGNLAKALADTNPDKVILEPYNEPHFKWSPDAWNSLSGQLVETIRANAPHHTIVINTSMAADPSRLAYQRVVSDGNVIYSVHYYRPTIFTAQGTAPGLPGLTGLPWPANAKGCTSATATAPQHATKISAYCAQTDQLKRMDADLRQLNDWRRRHQRAIWIGEFGVSARGADAESRKTWYRSAVAGFAKYNLPATMWSYDDCWGLAVKVDCPVFAAGDAAPNAFMGCELLKWSGRNAENCTTQISRARRRSD